MGLFENIVSNAKQAANVVGKKQVNWLILLN